MELHLITNEDPNFYTLMGPYLSKREIVNTLGGPVWDDAGKVWCVATEQDRVCGFGAVVIMGDKAHFCSDYILSTNTDKALYSKILKRILKHCSSKAVSVSATVLHEYAKVLEQNGFSEVPSNLKKYTKMEKQL